MNKIPRFMKEYANYEKQLIEGYELMQQKYKNKATENIEGALRIYEKGLITVDETMGLILNCFQFLDQEEV